MSRESAKLAALAWLKAEAFEFDEVHDEVAGRLAERFEDYARDWAKELGVAWHPEDDGDGGPGVPVLQPRYDALLEELAGYRRAIAAGGPDISPALLAIAVAELQSQVRVLSVQPGALTMEIEILEGRLEKYERDFAEAIGELLVDIPVPGTVASKLLAANVLMRRKIADLVAGKVGA
jgi:hypothetical protein